MSTPLRLWSTSWLGQYDLLIRAPAFKFLFARDRLPNIVKGLEPDRIVETP